MQRTTQREAASTSRRPPGDQTASDAIPLPSHPQGRSHIGGSRCRGIPVSNAQKRRREPLTMPKPRV